jgi:flagellar biosynthesis protein FlhF
MKNPVSGWEMKMQVKRFVAADMRRALELVRQELRPEAIILSSNRIPEGVELLTTLGSDSELMQLQTQASGRAALTGSAPMLSDAAVGQSLVEDRYHPSAVVLTPQTAHPNAGKTGAQLVEDIERAHQRMLAARRAEESAKEFLVGKNTKVNAGIPRTVSETRSTDYSPAKTTAPRKMTAAEKYPLVDDEPIAVAKPAAKSAPIPAPVESSSQLAELQAEIADMRLLLEQQLDRLAGDVTPPANTSVLASVARRLERLNLPKDVIGKILRECKKTKTISDAWPDALATMAHQLPVNGSDIVDKGGIFAFVGPTGVGKTTTIGKLAARYVLKHGADKVALITTDTYRIAAHDQLRSLARILRVPVRVVDEANSLDMVLRSLRNCSLILIDTAGFRHGDPHLKAQLKSLADIPAIKTHLVLSCNSQAQMLKASVHAYGAAKLQGCILTKLDETASMGEALGIVMQNRLPIVYTTDGQDIPKNIDVARAHQLVSRAVGLLKNRIAVAAS